MTDDRSAHQTVRAAANAGASIAMRNFRTGVTSETKDHPFDTVTQADRDAQRAARAVIERRRENPTLVGEERGTENTVPGTGPAWIVDPIDGTNNFANGNRLWGTVVSYVVEAEPRASVTAMPAIGDTYAASGSTATRNGQPVTVSDTAAVGEATVATVFGPTPSRRDHNAAVLERSVRSFGDVRRLGSGQATLAMVAAGEVDAVVSTVAGPPWDTVAGGHLVWAAGGTVTNLRGNPFDHESSSLVASNGKIHNAVRSKFADIQRP